MCVASDEVLFDLFAAALTEPGIADEVREALLAELGASGEQVRWAELEGLEPVQTLARAVACAVPGSGPAMRDASLWRSALGSQPDCRAWWRFLLARYNLTGPGDAVGGEEFIQLIVSAFRTLRDRYASEAFLRNLRTVRCGALRLADRYDAFECSSSGGLGRAFRCRSRTSGEELRCWQIRKDHVAAPADEVRAEAERLRRIEHPNLPQFVECLEDFNSIYMVSQPVRGLPLTAFLRERLAAARPLSEAWLASAVRQVLEVLRHCHEQRPRSFVHGDLRLESLALAGPEPEARLMVLDLGLADLLRLQPPRSSRPGGPGAQEGLLSEGASPRRDIWSCGCLLHLLLAGRQPCGTNGIAAFGDPLLLTAMPTKEQGSDHGALAHASPEAESICAQLLSPDPAARPSAAACLCHPWLQPRDAAAEHLLPLAVLEALVRLDRQRELCQAVIRDIVSELTAGAWPCPLTAFSEITAGSSSSAANGTVEVGSAAAQLLHLGISVQTMEKAVRAFDPDGSGRVALGRLAAGCAELAEDRLDQAIWWLFVAVEEDHRGILEVASLSQVLAGGNAVAGAAGSGATSADVDQGGAEALLCGLLGAETHAEAGEVLQQLARGGQQVTFEAFKEFVIQRHNAAFAARAAASSCRAQRSPRFAEEGRPQGQRGRPEAALLAAY